MGVFTFPKHQHKACSHMGWLLTLAAPPQAISQALQPWRSLHHINPL